VEHDVPPRRAAPAAVPTCRAAVVPFRDGKKVSDENALLTASSAQTGVWVAQQLEPENPFFNCGVVFNLDGAVDQAVLRRAVTRAVAETETLRTRFHDTPDGLRLTVEADAEPVLLVRDLSGAD